MPESNIPRSRFPGTGQALSTAFWVLKLLNPHCQLHFAKNHH